MKGSQRGLQAPRNSRKASTPFRRRLPQAGSLLIAAAFTGAPASLLLLGPLALHAQTGGEAGIQGTVTDSTGATVPNATVTATNIATGVITTRQATADGLFTISPIIPGTYNVSVKVAGFKEYTQQNLAIDALKLTGLNVALTIGDTNETVTVSAAPPALETTNAVLGAVLENSTYENLPLQANGQQRDPTAFATLVPGVQGGARAPIIGGTGNYLAAVYADGIPLVTINQQGDNRTVSNSIPVEAIDQFQVITSTPGAEYEGAGLINFTLKSGGNAYHGILATFVRNTIFDTWGFSAPALTQKTASGATIPAAKPVEHQVEIVASGGGPIPFTHKKGFFYVTYDKYHGRAGINPQSLTIPTLLERQGNFSELLPAGSAGAPNSTTKTVNPGYIYDPTTTAACTAANGGQPCRYAYQGNIIPQAQLSPIMLKQQSYLPTPTSSGTTGNYLGGLPSGYDNYEIASRLDFDITAKQRLSYVFTYGVRQNVPFTVGTNSVPAVAGIVLPLPYTAGGYATIKPVITDVEHTFQISEHIVNQFKFGFNRFSQPVQSLTDGVSPYRAAADFGITNLPAGQASNEFPGATFGTTTSFPVQLSSFTSVGATGATQTTVPNTFTLLDNLLIVKGKHSITVGGQIQWLEDNVAAQLGPSGIYTAAYNANSTADFGTNDKITLLPNSPTISTTTTGYSYASYLLGASPSTSIAIQGVSETGGRYRTMSPYVQDDWKVTPKLTVNLGLRWDYFPPFHEVQDRWSFLNPNLINAATGNKGALQFAGNHGGPGVSCGCRTPVQTYFKNFGPRVGFAYAVTPNTVIRGGYGLVYSLGGGVGGRAGAGNGTGATGFNVNATTPAEVVSGVGSGPSYYLNNSTAFAAAGLANTAYGGPGYTLPTLSAPSAASQILNTGNYVNGAGAFVTASGTAYADPYLSGRAPEFNMFNFGIQQSLDNDTTLTINYAGTQSHFLAPSGGNARGYWTNQLDPKYQLALATVADSSGKAPLLGANITPANLAILQKALPGFTLPYATISNLATRATVAQALVAFPQYSGVTDTWGQNVANISYNSLQVTVARRMAKGLSFTANYTWSKNMGDDGTFRSGYALPAGTVSGSTAAFSQDRIDRALTTTDVPENASIYGVWQVPLGKGHAALSGNKYISAIVSGFQLSSIFTYISGVPLAVTYAGCTAPLGGTCMGDATSGYMGSPRMNGQFGKGVTAASLGTASSVKFIDSTAFKTPNLYSSNLSTNYNQIGNLRRTAPYGLRAPGRTNDDISLRRTFPLSRGDRYSFIFEADCLNVANHPTFGNINTVIGSSAFGTVGSASGNRDFQLAGRLTF
ncbi:MAG: TonB-dependent receptor domain-containing protein [Janthinobacterium lividum]